MLTASRVVLLGLLTAACTTSQTGSVTTPAAVAGPVPSRQTVIVVGFDGFRRSYFDTDAAPVLHEVARTGVVSDGMIPSFPTATFPNLYALATGLYPEHSGIVNNWFYDPGFQAYFTKGGDPASNPRWWWGEPIWVTAQKHGVRSGVFFWVGSEAPVGGQLPTYVTPYEKSVPFADRVRQVLDWLDLPDSTRPSLIMVYFEEPDGSGHRYGPDAPETRAAVLRVDSALGQLVEGLRARKQYDQVNMLIVADHGMSAISPDRVVYLDDVVDSASVSVISLSPLLLIGATNGDNDALLTQLRQLPHVSVWPKADVPARLHYNEGARITPIVGVADDGWMIGWRHGPPLTDRGDHGYDNANASMRALFVAHGPAFKAGKTLPSFPNVDLYALMAHLLDIPPAPTDGTLSVFDSVLTTTIAH